MKILLDTHIVLWALMENDRLPKDVLDELNCPENEIYYSAVSIWELTVKHIKNPKLMPISGEEVAKYCDRFGYRRLPLINEHIYFLPGLTLAETAPKHNDPFDRMLICQAKAENMTFITHDSLLQYYNEPCVVTI